MPNFLPPVVLADVGSLGPWGAEEVVDDDDPLELHPARSTRLIANARNAAKNFFMLLPHFSLLIVVSSGSESTQNKSPTAVFSLFSPKHPGKSPCSKKHLLASVLADIQTFPSILGWALKKYASNRKAHHKMHPLPFCSTPMTWHGSRDIGSVR